MEAMFEVSDALDILWCKRKHSGLIQAEHGSVRFAALQYHKLVVRRIVLASLRQSHVVNPGYISANIVSRTFLAKKPRN